MVSQLEYLETLLNVDVDHMHPSVAKSLPFKPHDQTSNQLIVNEQIELPENRELLEKAVKEYGSKGWSAVLDRLVSSYSCHAFRGTYHFLQSVQLCAKNLPNIQGRVLLQTSPFHAYDKDSKSLFLSRLAFANATSEVVEHARNYAREFEKVGISR